MPARHAVNVARSSGSSPGICNDGGIDAITDIIHRWNSQLLSGLYGMVSSLTFTLARGT